MRTTEQLLGHWLRASGDGRSVRLTDSEKTLEGEVDEVRADSDGRRDYIKVTIKVPVPCERD